MEKNHHYATISKIIEVYQDTGKTSIKLSNTNKESEVIDLMAQVHALSSSTATKEFDKYMDTIAINVLSEMPGLESIESAKFALKLKHDMLDAKKRNK